MCLRVLPTLHACACSQMCVCVFGFIRMDLVVAMFTFDRVVVVVVVVCVVVVSAGEMVDL